MLLYFVHLSIWKNTKEGYFCVFSRRLTSSRFVYVLCLTIVTTWPVTLGLAFLSEMRGCYGSPELLVGCALAEVVKVIDSQWSGAPHPSWRDLPWQPQLPSGPAVEQNLSIFSGSHWLSREDTHFPFPVGTGRSGRKRSRCRRGTGHSPGWWYTLTRGMGWARRPHDCISHKS